MPGNVVDFYKGKNIFLTGGTGFFGKIIIEKLLRVCDVGGIFLLLRSKAGVSPMERLENIFKEPIFDLLRDKKQTISEKIHLIEGDLNTKDLEISAHDRKIIQENIHIVLHCGASLNMTDCLKEATFTNVRSTSELLKIMREARNLQAFILVSTAYSYCVKERIEEKFLPAPVQADLLIKMAEEMEPEVFERISEQLIAPWPNTYAFTKAVAESLLLVKGQKLPVALFRPAVVTSTAYEPMPGWTDNLYGPLGILFAQHCGVLRVIQGDPNIRIDTVPVDMAVNALLCLACDVHKRWKNFQVYIPPVLNFTSDNSALRINLRNYADQVEVSGAPPFRMVLWHPLLLIIKNRVCFRILWTVLHSIPSVLFDLPNRIKGKKLKLNSAYQKLEKVNSVLQYFMTREWEIENKNVVTLWDSLEGADKKMFPFDVNSVDAPTYFKSLLLGLKQYILKDDMSQTEKHKERYKRIVILHHLVKYISWILLICFLLKIVRYISMFLNRNIM